MIGDDLKKKYLNQINELLDLSHKNFFEDIQEIIRKQYKHISDEDVEEVTKYVEGFVECCTGYGDILANEFKAPYLPKGDKYEREIREYIEKCKDKYPGIEERYIEGIFSTVCWLANR